MAQQLSQEITDLFNSDCCTVSETINSINADPNTLALRTTYGSLRATNALNPLDLVTLQQLNNYVPLSLVGVPNGLAPLNNLGQLDFTYLPDTFISESELDITVPILVDGKIKVSNLPNSVMELQGFWNSQTNIPALVNGVGNPGDVWESINSNPSVNLGDQTFSINQGDWVVYAADNKWHKSVNSNEVTAVNGQKGSVTLTQDDIADTATTKRFLQGGNSFGANGVIGTQDNFPLFLRAGGANRVVVSNSVTSQIGNAANLNNGFLSFGSSTTAPTIQRNMADIYPALVVNNQNATSTGPIVNFSAQSVVKASIDRDGNFSGNNLILQGGNSFGIPMILGTIDNISMSIRTANTTRFNISTAGNISLSSNIITNGVSGVPTHSLTLPQSGTGLADYNTSDQTVNYERARLGWSGNIYSISTENSGTGIQRSLQVSAANRTLTVQSLALSGMFNFNGSTGTASSWIGTSGNMQANNNIQNGISILNAIVQTGTAGYRGLWISLNPQTAGSGPKLLIDAGTNTVNAGAGVHTSVFSVNSLGKLNIKTQVFNNNAEALAGGHIAGDVYRNSEGVLMVTF